MGDQFCPHIYFVSLYIVSFAQEHYYFCNLKTINKGNQVNGQISGVAGCLKEIDGEWIEGRWGGGGGRKERKEGTNANKGPRKRQPQAGHSHSVPWLHILPP